MKVSIHKKEQMDKVLQYIENNLYCDWNTNLLTNRSYVSRTQLYRDFYSITGHSVKEYIRKRRLSNALALIKSSDFSLSEIACGCGYSSQQAFCRTVKDACHMTPTEYKIRDEYYIFPPFNGNVVNQITISTETIPRTLCMKYYQSCLKEIENNAIDHLLSLVPQFKGRVFGINGRQDGTKYCYELYLSDTDDILEPLKTGSFVLSHVKASFTAAFASTIVRNSEALINSAWNYLYTDWLCHSMYEYTREHYFEEYLIKNGRPHKLRLFLPIQKHNEYMKITLEQIQPMQFIVSRAKGVNAEQIAAKKVIGYLAEQYPYVIKSSKEFYLQSDRNTCTCGVKLNSGLRISEEENIHTICHEEGWYAVLYSGVLGDYFNYRELLLSWLRDNGITVNEDMAYAVYDVTDSYDNPRMKLYCKVDPI